MTTMVSAALPATALVHPIDPVGVMPRGLTDSDGERIAAAIAAARTESTRHVYAGVWSRWERWCASRGVAALPGDPLAVCAYLTEQAADGRAMGTLDLICTVIRHVHRMCDLHNPTDALAVHQVRRGLRRTYQGPQLAVVDSGVVEVEPQGAVLARTLVTALGGPR